jgi:predicted outer membrane repeat protein
MSFLDARAVILKCDFLNNHADVKTKNIFVGFSDLCIIGSQFRNKILSDWRIESITGTFIFMILDVNLYLESTTFVNGQAYQGGAIYSTGTSTLTMKKT